MNSSGRILIALLALALLAPAVRAEDEDDAASLSPKRITEGWIMLFDGQTPFGWNIKGASQIADGNLILGGKDTTEETTAETTSEFGLFELTFQARGFTKGVQLLVDNQRYPLQPADDPQVWVQGAVRVDAKGNRWGLSAITVPVTKQSGAKAGTLALGLDTPPRSTLAFRVPAGNQLTLRAVHLKPFGMIRIFNGKDLTGWKPLPDHKSKYSVTEKGELNIKDGNGQIETEGQWADFLLQLEVFSNGKHLNSGVFFRTVPGQFWQGYEAQIRNEWQGYSGNPDINKKPEDRTKPVDCGTGGIYGHQDSRKVVSNDKEWFAYTVIANGPHMAAWVNGYQTADWTDKGRPGRTARVGRYLSKGTIALQGHDPTTDLSFRNIRIQELPEKK